MLRYLLAAGAAMILAASVAVATPSAKEPADFSPIGRTILAQLLGHEYRV